MTTFDFTMDQGSTNVVEFTIQNSDATVFNLTGYTASLMGRKSYGAGTPIINVTSTGVNPKLVLNTATGIITMTLDPIDTSVITFANSDDDTLDIVYDLEITNTASGTVYKPARGTITLNREITRG
jgi:hypothetical protein